MSKHTLASLRDMSDDELARAAMELGPDRLEIFSGVGYVNPRYENMNRGPMRESRPRFDPRNSLDHAWLLVEAVLRRDDRLPHSFHCNFNKSGADCIVLTREDCPLVFVAEDSPAAALAYACLLTL